MAGTSRGGGQQRQDRCGAVQRLDLGLLVHGEHHRSIGRVEVQADDVADLLNQLGVGGELEGVLLPGFEAKRTPYLCHGGLADAVLGRQRP